MVRDLRLFYLFRLLATSYLWVPIFVAFMRSRGLGFDEIALLHALYSVVVILVEVPTGALADRIGRRQSMMIGALAMVASCLTAYGAHSFAAFAVAEVLAAMSMALCSGADSAYLFDLLKKHDRGDEYPRREGMASAWHLVGSGLAFAAGGLLGSVDLALPYLFTAAVSAVAFAIALSMRTDRPIAAPPLALDPRAARPSTSPEAAHLAPPLGGPPATSIAHELRIYLHHMSSALRDAAKNPRLAWSIGYAAVVFVLLRSTVVLYQPYLDSRGFSIAEIGFVYAGSAIAAALAARRFGAICRKLGEEPLAYGLLAALTVSFLLLHQLHGAWAPLSMLLVQAVANGLYSPLAKTMLNRNITDSSRRATILSLESIARRAAMGLFWPVAGVVGASSAMYLCGGVGFVGFIALALVGTRVLGSVGQMAHEIPIEPGRDRRA
ncbi:MAG: MFS transporter [Haliangiales bacterium]